MKVDGQCHCGALRCEAELDPENVVLSHCTDCQQLSGTSFRVVAPTLPGAFGMLTGQPSIYVKTAESGRQREQALCPECGSQIHSAPVETGQRAFGLRVGTLRQEEELIPRVQSWSRSAQGWLAGIATILRLET